jgi:hypothetical protein
LLIVDGFGRINDNNMYNNIPVPALKNVPKIHKNRIITTSICKDFAIPPQSPNIFFSVVER